MLPRGLHSPQDTPPALALPTALEGIHRSLSRRGFQAWLVGESLHALLRGESPRAFQLSSDAPPQTLLDVFPAAVPTRLQEGTVTLPSSAGPVDLTQFRDGHSVESDLSHCDFSIHALAYDPASDRRLDPFDGESDLRAGRLRAVGRAADRLNESPLRALRAARLCAAYGYRAESELERALASLARDLPALPALPARREIFRMLLATRAATGLALLRRSGLEAALVRGVRDDAAALVESLPEELSLRLAAWLRGTKARDLLRKLRVGVARSTQVLRLLQHHPVECAVSPQSESAVRRLLRRLNVGEIDSLLALRECELRGCDPVEAGAARAGLAQLRSTIEHVRLRDEQGAQRVRLAVDGRGVMEALGCGPGPRVGEALCFLEDQVAAEPSCNTPEGLRERLARWVGQDRP